MEPAGVPAEFTIRWRQVSESADFPDAASAVRAFAQT